ncbi:MAG: extracellular solute-binding protein [Deltaproteobacteria bacterium]|nr:extracellular solute-binding protein [Deltaproteobacteria bacterium]
MSFARPILLLACLALGAAGCRDERRDDPRTVDFWAMGREGELVKQLVPAFEQRNPGVRVRVQQIPWSAAHEKLVTALVGGTMPDAFQLGSTWVSEFVALRALEPLDGRGDASGGDDAVFPGIAAANVVGGRTWGVPWYVDTRVLFVRTDLLEKARCVSPLRTWDAWLDCMARVRDAAPGRFAILLPLTEWEAPVILAMQRGATLLRDGDGRGDFRSPAFRAAFATYTGLFSQGLAPRGSEAQASSLYQGFGEGLFSFVLTGPWNLAQFAARLPADLTGRWTTMALPAPDDHHPGVSLAGGSSLAVWSGSPAKDAAFRWTAWLAEPEQQAALYRASGALPARRGAWRALGLDTAPGTRAFWEQLGNVRPPPRVPEWERIATLIGRRAEGVIRGEETIDAALTSLDEEVDRILEKRRWMNDREGATRGAER